MTTENNTLAEAMTAYVNEPTKRLTLTHLQAAVLFDSLKEQLEREDLYNEEHGIVLDAHEIACQEAGWAVLVRLQKMNKRFDAECAGN